MQVKPKAAEEAKEEPPPAPEEPDTSMAEL